MRICSLASVKAAITPSPPTDHDAVLTQILEDVSARMAHALNRELRRATYTEYFRTPCNFLSLRARPVVSVTSITYYDTALGSDLYSVNLEYGFVYFIDWVTNVETDRQLKVIYIGGYEYATGVGVESELLTATGDLHLVQIQGAVRKQTVFEYSRRKELGLTSVSMPSGSVGKVQPSMWLAEVLDVIAIEKRRALG